MTVEAWALLVSFIAMLLIASSYFFKKKSGYLLFQATGMAFLISSYFLDGEYFATIGLGVGLMRALVYFAYEKRNKKAPLAWAFVFTGLTVAVYFIVNLWILRTAKPQDIVYLASLTLYAFIFRIRDLEFMRYAATIPTVLAVLYNVLCKATPFIVASYAFELGANIASILKYHVLANPKEIQQEKEYEKH